jgi:phage terminase small subunit
MALSAKQQLFIDHYLISYNATEAALRAGYSEKTAYSQGARLLKNVEISTAIDERLSESAMRADEVLRRLAEQARSEHARYIVNHPRLDMVQMALDGKGDLIPAVIDEHGNIDVAQMARDGVLELYAPYIHTSTYVDLDAMRQDGMMHLVKGVKQTKEGLQVEFYDAQSALQLIGKHHSLFVDRQEVTGKDGGPIETTVKHDLSRLSVDELKAMRDMVAKATNADT